MQFLPWDKNFETGLPDVDRQHQSLVALINRVGELLMNTDVVTLAEINAVYDELADYSRYHFREEEKMMSESGIDPMYLGQHIRLHVSFLQDLNRMRGEMGSRGYEGADMILKYLTYWLAFHILGQDMSTARQLRAIERGKTALDAYKAEEAVRQSGTEPLLHALAGLFQQITDRNRELSALNARLEQKVEERTHALQEANRRLEALALTDVLTGLPNRRHAMLRLEDEWSRSATEGRPLAAMMIDADGFKQINDSHGHEAGDEVLRQLARALKHAVRTDDVVCRLGGDEFLILCPDTSLEGVLHAAESVRKAISGVRIPARSGTWTGSISVGVATRTPDMESPEDLIRAADEGVYLAKRGGRNQVAFAAGWSPQDLTTRESQRPPIHRTTSDARRMATRPTARSSESPRVSVIPRATH